MTWYGIVWHGLAWQCGGRSCLLGWRRGGPLHDCSPLDDAIRARIHGCCTRGCGSSAARSSTMLRPLPTAILACRPSSSLAACIFDPLQPIGVLRPNDATVQIPRFGIEAERGDSPPLCRPHLAHLVLFNFPCGCVPLIFSEPELYNRCLLLGGELRYGLTPGVRAFGDRIRPRPIMRPRLRSLTSVPHG